MYQLPVQEYAALDTRSHLRKQQQTAVAQDFLLCLREKKSSSLLVSLVSMDVLLDFHSRALRGTSCGSNQLCSLNPYGRRTKAHAEFAYCARDRKESPCILSSPGSLDRPFVCCCL